MGDQVLGAATLMAIERLEKMTKQTKDAAPTPEELRETTPAPAWRHMPSVGTWAMRRVAPINLPKFPETPRQVKNGNKVPSASPKVASVRRSPRHTAPPAPVRMGLKEKVEKVEKVQTEKAEKVPQKSPKVPSLRDVRPSVTASAPTLLGATRLPQVVKPPVKRTPNSTSAIQTETKVRSKPSPRPVVRSNLATRAALSTAEIEARQIEEKRKQAKFLAEKNARHMARAQAVKEPVKPQEVIRKVSPEAKAAKTKTVSPETTKHENKETRSPTQQFRDVKAEAPRGVKVATAPTPARNTVTLSKGASKGSATPTMKGPSLRPASQEASAAVSLKAKILRPPSPLARTSPKGTKGSSASAPVNPVK